MYLNPATEAGADQPLVCYRRTRHLTTSVRAVCRCDGDQDLKRAVSIIRRVLQRLHPYRGHFGADCSAGPGSESTSGSVTCSVSGAGSMLCSVAGARSVGRVGCGSSAPGSSVPAGLLSAPLGLPSVVRPPSLGGPSWTCPGTSDTSSVGSPVSSATVKLPLSTLPSVVVCPLAPPSMLDVEETRLEMG